MTSEWLNGYPVGELFEKLQINNWITIVPVVKSIHPHTKKVFLLFIEQEALCSETNVIQIGLP